MVTFKTVDITENLVSKMNIFKIKKNQLKLSIGHFKLTSNTENLVTKRNGFKLAETEIALKHSVRSWSWKVAIVQSIFFSQS